MRMFGISVIATGLILSLSGCGTSPTGGGTKPASGNGVKDETFTVDKVTLPITIKQDSAGDVTIKINRGKDFKQSVKLSAEDVPEKVKVEFVPATIKPENDPKSLMKISAESKAAMGKHTIKVKATPEKGEATSIDVEITVASP